MSISLGWCGRAMVAAIGLSSGLGYVATAASLPPVSVKDILDYQQIETVKMAPDGRSVAFVTRRALLDQKKNQDTLSVVTVQGKQTRELFKTDQLDSVAWSRDGRALFGLAKENDTYRLVRIDAAKGGGTALWETKDRVDALAISPDGSACLLAVSVAQEVGRQERHDHGLVHDYYKNINIRDTTGKQYVYADFHLVDVASGKVRRIARRPYEGYQHMGFVEKLTFAPDLKHIAVEITRPGKPKEGGPGFNHDIGILTTDSGEWMEPITPSIQTDMGQVWLDRDRLFFFNDGRGVIYHLGQARLERLPWAGLGKSWVTGTSYNPNTDEIVIQQSAGVSKLSFKDKKISQMQASFGEPSYAEDFQSFAFVAEASQERPQIAVTSVKTKKTEKLTQLNGYLDGHALGSVEKVTLKNEFGTESTAYLVYPVNYVKGQRYPLLLASYGFSGKFLLTAEWHTTFPVQALAGQGYVTLLVNTPPVQTAQTLVGDPVKARHNEGWEVMSTFETAVKTLVDRGIADPKNVGLYGWSHGVFVVEFILAHSKMPFTAACVGEGGDYNPGGYWIGGTPSWPGIFQNTYGGPFTRKTAEAYLEFAPVLSVDKVNTPLFMEFKTENTQYGYEFYVPLRERSVPVELVMYDDEEHNFVRPTVRYISMHRKIDWFNFWMKGIEDPAPAKAEQYVRWRQLRTDWKAKAAH